MLLIYNLVLVWLENRFWIISILNSWRLVLWPFICFHLMNVPYALEKNMYSVIVWYIILYISVKLLIVLLLSSLSLLIFCLLVLSITERGVIKSPFTIMYLSIFLSFFVSFYLLSFGALKFVAYMLIIVMSFWWIDLFLFMKSPSLSLVKFFIWGLFCLILM